MSEYWFAYFQKHLKPPQLCAVFHILELLRPFNLNCLENSYYCNFLYFFSEKGSINIDSFLENGHKLICLITFKKKFVLVFLIFIWIICVESFVLFSGNVFSVLWFDCYSNYISVITINIEFFVCLEKIETVIVQKTGCTDSIF